MEVEHFPLKFSLHFIGFNQRKFFLKHCYQHWKIQSLIIKHIHIFVIRIHFTRKYFFFIDGARCRSPFSSN